MYGLKPLPFKLAYYKPVPFKLVHSTGDAFRAPLTPLRYHERLKGERPDSLLGR